MKLLVISDIHGSPVYLKKVLDIFERENYDKLILLGDELYHDLETLSLRDTIQKRLLSC